MSDFVHLHVHTEYSLLDGLCRTGELPAAVARSGMKAVAMTDHGNLFGAVPFVAACRTAGIQPILGAEVNLQPGSAGGEPFHLTLLAASLDGYRHLMQLLTVPYWPAATGNPGISLDDLGRWCRGLICLTGCGRGPLSRNLGHGQEAEARRWAGTLRELFGQTGVYVELQDQGLPFQAERNGRLARLADECRLPVVATGNVHYLAPDQARLHDVLLAIGAGRTVADPDCPRYPTNQFYLQTPGEMAARYRHRPDAVGNTAAIAERCAFTWPWGPVLLPDYPVPAGYTHDSYLAERCRLALPERYPGAAPAVQQRLDYELGVIRQMGYASYFLIVWDFVRFARSAGIPVGPGRGSGAGSLVAYLLGITAVDPLRFGLLFERFLNPSRVDLPDFDIDFCYERRDEVIRYVTERYGADRVAQIITFGTLAARAAVRDVGRALGLPNADVDRLARRLPPGLSLDDALAAAPETAAAVAASPRLGELVTVARALEGLPRHPSTHAAGVVMAPGPLTDHVPLYRTADGVITTQYDMDALKAIGLLKMDFLGLRTLTVIDRAVRAVQERAPGFALDDLPLTDAATYAMLAEGQSVGVFQLEQPWVADVLRQIKPRRFEDIVAAISLCRPGPMQYIPEFVAAREGGGRTRHPDLEPILADTHGIMVYQEQVMRVAEQVAGFSLAEADLLRRAVGKKRREELESYGARFVAGAVEKGYDGQLAADLYADILRFAGYGFNRAHAVAYALVAFQTAYLKRHHPAEFLAALMGTVAQQEGKIALYVAECRRLGLRVLPPDINTADAGFSSLPPGPADEPAGVRFGLAAVKNVGWGAVDAIVAERNLGGPFVDLADLCARISPRHLNRKAVECLIKAGACDGLGDRQHLLNAVDAALSSGSARHRLQEHGQLSLFGPAAAPPAAASGAGGAAVATPPAIRLAMEKEALGLYLTAHPLDVHAAAVAQLGAVPLAQVADTTSSRGVTVAGVVLKARRIRTRSGEWMAFVQLDDPTGSAEVVVFPRVLQQHPDGLQVGAALWVRGRLDGEDEVKLIAEDLGDLAAVAGDRPGPPVPPDPPMPPDPPVLYLRLPVTSLDDPLGAAVRQALNGHPGPTPVRLKLQSGRWVEAAAEHRVTISPELVSGLQELLGPDNVVVR